MPADPTAPSRSQPALTISNRRQFMLGGVAAAALGVLLRSPAHAETAAQNNSTAPPTESAIAQPQGGRVPASDGLTHSAQFEEVLKGILADAEPAIGEPLSLDLPELAENGNVVPYTLSVENPMTDTDYVRFLYLLSTSNPQALVAKFHLIPASGKAMVSGRMRLAKTQDVVAIAEVSTGAMLVAVRKVDVTIGGCGNE